jgi:hypothetical protein
LLFRVDPVKKFFDSGKAIALFFIKGTRDCGATLTVCKLQLKIDSDGFQPMCEGGARTLTRSTVLAHVQTRTDQHLIARRALKSLSLSLPRAAAASVCVCVGGKK